MIQNMSDFFLKFPQFYSINNNKNGFKGSFIIEGTPCTVEMYLPNFPKIQNFKCSLKNNLTCIDISNKAIVNQNWDVDEFLNHLPEIWQEQNQNLNFGNELDHGKGVLNILNQILACQDELDNVKMYTNDALTCIKFDYFLGYEGHYLELKVENFTVEVKDHSLPNFSDEWKAEENNDQSSIKCLFSSPSTVVGYLKQFFKLLENFDLFYKYIHALDDLCWIVEPSVVTSKCNWRMFKLIDNVYIKVILNPLCPNSITVNLYGPTMEVEKYREIYQENFIKWDSELDVYNNLLKVFDLMLFPCRDTTINLESDDLNCKICLCYLDDDEHIPICSCDNSKCSLLYHVSCLKRWFANSVEGRTFLSVAMGVCPFCKEKLSASFKSLLDV